MQKLIIALMFSQIHLLACAHADTRTEPPTCESSQELRDQRSTELKQIVAEDQADRSRPADSIDWSFVSPRDLQRRIRVATIFAEGCFYKASDYAAAAMVYQHGTTDDHYFQTFVWANKALKLGDETQRWLVAASIDRYLVKIGHKQLFGTQLSRPNAGDWCVQPVEPTFPNTMRIEFVKLSVKEQTARTLKGIGAKQSVNETRECEPALKPSPKGTVPGFW